MRSAGPYLYNFMVLDQSHQAHTPTAPAVSYATGTARTGREAVLLVGVTRARMTHIANLMLLTPALQEAVLELTVSSSEDSLTNRRLRPLHFEVHSKTQEGEFFDLHSLVHRHPRTTAFGTQASL